MEGNDSAGDALENISDNCTVLGLSCLQADLQDVFLNPHLFPLTQVFNFAAIIGSRDFIPWIKKTLLLILRPKLPFPQCQF